MRRINPKSEVNELAVEATAHCIREAARGLSTATFMVGRVYANEDVRSAVVELEQAVERLKDQLR